MFCLQVCLDVDEALYSTFGPRQLLAAMDKVRGFQIPQTRSWHGLHAAVVVKFGLVLLGITLALMAHILPLREKLVEAGNALCGIYD